MKRNIFILLLLTMVFSFISHHSLHRNVRKMSIQKKIKLIAKSICNDKLMPISEIET